MEIHRMHHRRRDQLQGGRRLVAAVGHRELDAIADARAHDGPGTWSPNVHALKFTPGAISMILCVVSRRTSFTGLGASGFSGASILSASPAANAPLCGSALSAAGPGLKSIFDVS